MKNKIVAASSKFDIRPIFFVIALFLTVAIGLAVPAANETLNLNNLSIASGDASLENRGLGPILKAESVITVNSFAQSPGVNGDCTLGEAIQAANTNTAVDGCTAGSGDATIQLPAGTYTLSAIDNTETNFGTSNGLPLIVSPITIQGAGAALTIIQRSSATGIPEFRFFQVSIGSEVGRLTLNDLTLKNGRTPSYGAGAIFPYDVLTINNCHFENNSTGIGGAGGGVIGSSFGYTAIINNSTFTGNSSGGVGGAIGTPSDLTLTNSTFTNNTSVIGGGAIGSASAGTVNISGTTFTNNSVTGDGSGGAIRGHTFNITDSIFNGNSTPTSDVGNKHGGTIRGDTVEISNSSISGGSAGGWGGGIFGNNVTVTNSTISGNTAQLGGGISIHGGTVTVRNSTISGNSARESGGGISVVGNLFLNNATITNNTADSGNNGQGHAGGGIRADGTSGTIKNSIIAGNHELGGHVDFYTGATSLTSQGYNLIGDNAGCNIVPTAGDQFGTSAAPINPLLGALQNNGGATQTHALLANSPAIDTANPATPDGTGNSCLPTDQRIAAIRPGDGDGNGTSRCDIGAFEIVPLVPTSLAFTVQPSATTAGQPISPAIQVEIKDQFGSRLEAPGLITISINNNAGGSTLSGTLTRNTVNGVAVFEDLSLNRSGAGYTLRAASGSVFVTSNAFEILPGAPHQLGFTVQPTNESVQAVLSPALEVTIQDQLGNRITGATNAVTIAIATNPGGSTLTGTPTRSAVNGAATFNDLSLNKIGDGYTLRATAGGLQSATSDAFNITSGVPHQVGFTVHPTNTNSEHVITPPVQVTIQDEFGNSVPSATNEITVAFGNNNPGSATLGGTLTRTAVNGVATFDDLSVSHGGNYFLLASSNGLISGRSNVFNIIDPAVINITEQILVTDAPTLLPSAMINVTENIAVQDAPALLPSAMITVNENISVLDTQEFPPSTVTPTGTNVTLQFENVTITFTAVSTSGFTNVAPIDPASAGSLPNGFSLCEGCPAYEIITSATYTPPIAITIKVPSVTDPVVFSHLKVLHGENSVLVDRTTAQKFTDKTVSGSVASLSPFVIAQGLTPTAADGSISGQIIDTNGNPVGGAVMRLSGTQNRLTITDVQGKYYFDNVETNGFYTLTPAHANFTFSPSQRSFSALGHQTEALFTASANATRLNPLDGVEFFVRQHYLDFLNREPDELGFNFWSEAINACGSDASCLEVKRINTSAAYFLSIEFQQTGYLVYRMYKAAYGNLPGAPVPVRFDEFMPDTRAVGHGVVVRQSGWEEVLENNRNAYAAEFVQRSRFATDYPGALTPAQFVDRLFTNAGVTPAVSERSTAIDEFGSAATTGDAAARARALRRVAENSVLRQQEFNRAFVLMEYFGYLRRDPDQSPDNSFEGYSFWLGKLNQFNGNFEKAEMVMAFINSSEYRRRFGP